MRSISWERAPFERLFVCEVSKLAPEGVPELVSEFSLLSLLSTFIQCEETNIRYTAFDCFFFSLHYFSPPFFPHTKHTSQLVFTKSWIEVESTHHTGDCWCISSG